MNAPSWGIASGIRRLGWWVDFELGQVVWNDQPDVFVSSPNRLRWLRELGICKGAKCDADDIRHTAGFPIDARPTANAEVKTDREAARRIAFEAVSNAALHGNPVSLIENRDAKCASGSPLAIEAVAHRDLSWVAVAPKFNIPAVTASCARLHRFRPGGASGACRVGFGDHDKFETSCPRSRSFRYSRGKDPQILFYSIVSLGATCNS